jgi:hypothetical protein
VWFLLVFVAVRLLLLVVFVGFDFCCWGCFGVAASFMLLVLSLLFGVCLLVVFGLLLWLWLWLLLVC